MSMQSDKFFAALKQALPETSYPDVIAAFRQDSLVWEGIQDETLFARFLETCGSNLQRWSPATLSLLTLDYPVSAVELQVIPLLALEPAVRQKAAHIYEETFRTLKPPAGLEEAGLLALALRERRRLTDAWQGLLTELQINPAATPDIQLQVWRTPLAILYGLTPDAPNLLRSLLPKSGSAIHPAQIDLVLHGLLSNPASLREQAAILANLVSSYTVEEQLVWLDRLTYLGRGQLASELSKTLLQGQSGSHLAKVLDHAEQRSKLSATLNSIAARQQLAAYHLSAGETAQSLPLLDDARHTLQSMQAELACQVGEIHYAKKDLPAAISAFKQAVELQPDDSAYRSNLAICLAEADQTAEAVTTLADAGEDAHTLLARAFILHQNGEIVRAQELGRQAAGQLSVGSTTGSTPAARHIWNQPADIVRVFSQLGLTDEAIATARKALRTQAADGELLVSAATALDQKGATTEAEEAVHTAVVLNPHSLPYRRIYADLLEKQGNWAASLGERSTINQCSEEPTVEDLSALANSAIHNGQAEMAVHASHAILNMNPENGLAHIFLGEACQLEKDSLGALQHFTQATLLSPEEPKAWLALADYQKQNGDPYKALETLRAGAHASPQSAEIQWKLAEEYLSSGSPSEALPALRKANSLAPGNPEISVRLGDILRDLGHLGESKQVLERARKVCPTHPALAYSHGKTLIALGEPQAAVPALLATLEANPEDTEPYLLYSRLVLDNHSQVKPDKSSKSPALNPLDGAFLKQALEKALEIDPANRELNLRYAQTLALSGNLDEALRKYQELIEKGPKDNDELSWQAKLGLGQTAMAMKQLDMALAAIQDAVALAPEEVSAHQALSEALLEANLKAEALESAKNAFKLAPRDQSNLEWYARIVYRLGAHSECVAALERALELDPGNAEIALTLARVQIEANNPQAAGEALETILEKDAVDPSTLEDAGAMWLTLGDYQSAIRSFEKAILKSHDPNGDIWFKLALVHAQTGNIEEALDAAQKSANLQPGEPCRMLFQADLLSQLDRNQAALACYEESLQLGGETPIAEPEAAGSSAKLAELPLPDFIHVAYQPHQIHLKIANLLRRQGEISAALTHAEKSLAIEPNNFNAHSLAAELASGMLDNDAALSLARYPSPEKTTLDRILPGKDASETERKEAANLLSIRGELELDAGDVQNAMCAISQALDLYPRYGRALAVQARIDVANGDFKSAEQHWEAAVNSLNTLPQATRPTGAHPADRSNQPSSTAASAPTAFNPADSYPMLSMAQAALDIQQWDTALALFNQAARQAPDEPRVHLALSRAIVLCAEAQKTFTAAKVINHAPGVEKLSSASAATFDEGIQAANRLSIHSQINRWHKRGQAVFHPSLQTLRALTGLPSDPEDIAAAIAVCREIKDKETGVRLANQYPTHPAVSLQLALLQAESSPAEACLTARSISSNPHAHPIHLALFAELAMQTGDTLPGLEAIESALEIWPNEPEWRVLAAELNDLCQDNPSVVEHLSQAYQLDPENPDYAFLLGKAYLKNQQVKEAIQYLDSATRLKPDCVEAWTLLARAFQAANENLRAVACAEKAVSIAPDQADPLVVCGEIALDAGQFDLVHQHAEAALKIDPSNPQALLLLVKVLDVEGEPQEALEALEQFLPSASDPYPLKLERINLLRKIQSPQAVLEALEALDIEYPNDPWILARLAEVLADNGQREAAEKTAQTSLRLQPLQPELHLLVGRIQRAAGQLDQAIYHLNEAIQQSNRLVDAYLELGRAYQDRRESHQAMQVYQKAMEIVPKDPRPYYQAGLSMKEGKDYVGAEAMLRKAAELAPEDTNIRRQLVAIIALNLVHNPQEASA